MARNGRLHEVFETSVTVKYNKHNKTLNIKQTKKQSNKITSKKQSDKTNQERNNMKKRAL